MNIKSVLKTYISKYAIYGLAAIAAVNGVGWYVTGLKLDVSNEVVRTKTAEVKTVQAECKSSASEAKAKNLEEIRKIENGYNKLAQEADTRINDLRKQFNANLLLYAKAKGSTGGVFVPNPDDTESSDGPSKDTVIPVVFGDAEICAENTARIQTVKEWSDKLQSQ